MDIIFYNSSSPQVKRTVIITNKHGIYDLPHKLPNNLTLRSWEIRKNQKNLKSS